MSAKDIFLMIAMLTVFIPVGVALVWYSKLIKPFRYLALFLAFSFLFDIKQYIEVLIPYRAYFYVTFGLLQLLFYLWFMVKVSPQLAIFRYRSALYAGFVVLWVLCYGPIVLGYDILWQRSVFNVAQAVCLSYLSAFALLELTKQDIPLIRRSLFWFFSGIFIYFFMNTFLYAFMHTSFRDQIWFLHSIFDISKNVLFAIGFFVASRQRAA